ncbi:TetR/AcrR family transcriptional regulator [Tamlana fucoidanivorans]|uniref:TetR/AcrR family transcriptional regulator n=1 Tax=Allotamlana fucoidanivorans TaxID=2583814 RepID=A0A5C4SCG3_9FLAO|nr:TetR/AcrR family transcriptional regulator [Tamlana fucoidanivorans]TNJ41249.1 TetR/AcrR family transcriptional regulator [Tamlana fucoidanivorans]
MERNKKYSEWIDAAYKEFACNGPDFSLKALAKKTNLPRATFYYYFNNKEHLIEDLLKHHAELNESFQSEIKTLKTLIPGLYEIMYKYRVGVRFHQQLLKHTHIQEFYMVYNEFNRQNISLLLPLIKPYFGGTLSDNEICQFYITLTDAWYSRLNFSNLSVNYMISLAEEIMNDTIGVIPK